MFISVCLFVGCLVCCVFSCLCVYLVMELCVCVAIWLLRNLFRYVIVMCSPWSPSSASGCNYYYH